MKKNECNKRGLISEFYENTSYVSDKTDKDCTPTMTTDPSGVSMDNSMTLNQKQDTKRGKKKKTEISGAGSKKVVPKNLTEEDIIDFAELNESLACKWINQIHDEIVKEETKRDQLEADYRNVQEQIQKKNKLFEKLKMAKKVKQVGNKVIYGLYEAVGGDWSVEKIEGIGTVIELFKRMNQQKEVSEAELFNTSINVFGRKRKRDETFADYDHSLPQSTIPKTLNSLPSCRQSLSHSRSSRFRAKSKSLSPRPLNSRLNFSNSPSKSKPGCRSSLSTSSSSSSSSLCKPIRSRTRNLSSSSSSSNTLSSVSSSSYCLSSSSSSSLEKQDQITQAKSSRIDKQLGTKEYVKKESIIKESDKGGMKTIENSDNVAKVHKIGIKKLKEQRGKVDDQENGNDDKCNSVDAHVYDSDNEKIVEDDRNINLEHLDAPLETVRLVEEQAERTVVHVLLEQDFASTPADDMPAIAKVLNAGQDGTVVPFEQVMDLQPQVKIPSHVDKRLNEPDATGVCVVEAVEWKEQTDGVGTSMQTPTTKQGPIKMPVVVVPVSTIDHRPDKAAAILQRRLLREKSLTDFEVAMMRVGDDVDDYRRQRSVEGGEEGLEGGILKAGAAVEQSQEDPSHDEAMHEYLRGIDALLAFQKKLRENARENAQRPAEAAAEAKAVPKSMRKKPQLFLPPPTLLPNSTAPPISRI